MPAWVSRYLGYPTTTVASGYKVNADGNVPADPNALAAAAGRKLGVAVSLDAYTLARYVTSEVGNQSVPERVAVMQDAVNRVRYVEGTNSLTKLLLYRQPVGHKNRGFYGPIHGKIAGITDVASAPYKRWASTSRDPSVSNLMLAIGVLNGDIPADFNKGADDQMGPEHLKDPVASVRSHGRDRRQYWVGPLPGVDPWRTIQYRTMKDVAPDSQLGQFLIARGEAAMRAARPNWNGLPDCQTGQATVTTAAPGAGVVIGAAALATAGVVGAALFRRRQRRGGVV